MSLKEFPERASDGIDSNNLLQWHLQISSPMERVMLAKVLGGQEGSSLVYLL